MNPFETLRIALRALLRNKTRSSLTALGIIIGVAAVIAVMAIGEGAKKQIEAQFAAMGTNLLILQPGSSTASGVRGGSGSSSGGGTIIGGATAIGNSLNVVVQGNHNTVIVNSNQINNGNITAGTVLNGTLDIGE